FDHRNEINTRGIGPADQYLVSRLGHQQAAGGLPGVPGAAVAIHGEAAVRFAPPDGADQVDGIIDGVMAFDGSACHGGFLAFARPIRQAARPCGASSGRYRRAAMWTESIPTSC